MALVAQTTTPKNAPNSARKAARPKPGVISGHVFAITAGGDIKPARLAKAYLLYSSDESRTAATTEWYLQLSIAFGENIALNKSRGEHQEKIVLRLEEERLRVASDESYALMTAAIAAAAPEEKDRLKALGKADLIAQKDLRLALLDIEQSLILNHDRWSDEITCRRELLTYDKALGGVRRSRWEQRDWSQFLSADADEEGRFRIVIPRSGKYLLIV